MKSSCQQKNSSHFCFTCFFPVFKGRTFVSLRFSTEGLRGARGGGGGGGGERKEEALFLRPQYLTAGIQQTRSMLNVQLQ